MTGVLHSSAASINIRRALAVAAALAFLFPTPARADEKTAKPPPSPHELRETVLGDVAADAMRLTFAADAALLSAEALAPKELKPGMKDEEIRSLVPYEMDSVVLIEASGGQILSALERSVSNLPNRFSGFLQVSGLAFTIVQDEKTKNRIENVRIAGKPLNPEGKYRIATLQFLSKGGSGYSMLKSKPLNEGESPPLQDLFVKRVRSLEKIPVEPEKRMKMQ